MISPSLSFEEQAAQLLRIACGPTARQQLLRYAHWLSEGDEATVNAASKRWWTVTIGFGGGWVRRANKPALSSS